MGSLKNSVAKTSVLFLCEFPTLNGGEYSLLSITGRLSELGFKLTIAGPPGGPLQRAASESEAEFAPVVWRASNGAALPLSERQGRLIALIRHIRPNVVHANSLSMSRLSGIASTASGIPSVGHLRDIIKLNRKTIADLNLNRQLVAVSQATAAFHIRQGLQRSRIAVSYNGVNLNRFCPRSRTGAIHEELNLPRSTGLVLSVGQLVLRKGLDNGMHAMRQVMQTVEDLHWLIVGERYSTKAEAVQHEADLRQMASESPMRGRVHFLGYRNDLPLLLNECDLLLHTAHQEPLGRVLLEAAASGTAVVATDVGGTCEIFPHGSNSGILVPPADSTPMANAVQQLWRDPQVRHQLGMNARAIAESKFSHRSAADRLSAIYGRLLRC